MTTLRTLSYVLLIVSLLLSSSLFHPVTSTSVFAATSPIEKHWAAEVLQAWVDQGWLPSMNRETIRPDDPVTRAEFAAFINQALQFTEAADKLPFTDITNQHWAHREIAIAYRAGYMRGNDAQQVMPDRYTTRQEVAVMLTQTINLPQLSTQEQSTFSDFEAVASWAQPAVTVLARTSILKGDTNGRFRPLSFMTRAEAVIAIDAAATYLALDNKAGTSILSRLQVSDNDRFLTNAQQIPFFWLGDTAWELAHRSNRSEVNTYLRNASENGYTVIQFVALAELKGLSEPNAYGHLPLVDKNPTKPAITAGSNHLDKSEYDYWDHIDYIIDTANTYGLYIALLPSWGSYLWENRGQRAEPIFDASSAYQYGEWLGQRYADRDNVIWVLGGDRIPDSPEKLTIIRNMANGLNDGGGTQLKTFHPWGGKSSSTYFHNDDWLDFNSYQSGHPRRDYENDQFATIDYKKSNPKPTIDIEPRYEHLPINFNLNNGRFDSYDARQAAYWSVFAGAFGHTYGHNSIWQMYDSHRPPSLDATMYWTSAINAEGRTTLKWLRELMESRPMLSRVPDQSLLVDDLTGANRIMGTRGDDYAFIYSSSGTAFEVNMGRISGETVQAQWYNPRTGAYTFIADYPNSGKQLFTPPSQGRGQDWVLVLDAA